MQVQGTVKDVSSFDYQGTLLYSFTLQGDNTYYRTGRDAPSFQSGANVSFDATMGKKPGSQDVKIHTVQMLEGAPSPSVAQVAPQATPQGMSRAEYWDEKDRYDKAVRQPAIEFQAARNAAISIVTALVANESMPGITKTATPAKRAEVFEAAVAHYTEQFFEDLPHKTGGE
jgi:hypothetical protein